ncbi:flagellar protein FlaG [Paraglaciecola aestuariivivens]
MDINTSQVGQNFALNRAEPKLEKEKVAALSADSFENNAQQIKANAISAEIEIQDSELNEDSIETAVTQISEFVQANNRQLNFSIDEGSKKQVVKVTDAESGEVIRQIPSAEVLKLSERLQDLQTDVGNVVGMLFSKQV